MTDIRQHIDQYRTKAEQFRSIGLAAPDIATRRKHLEAARCYDHLADDAERMAADAQVPGMERPQ